MTDSAKHVLISTQTFPPMSTGSSLILYSLLRHLPPKEMIAVCAICDPPLFEAPSLGIEQSRVLCGGSYTWTLRCMRRLPRLFAHLARRRIIALARRHHVRRIYAHFPNAPFLIAAWQAAERLDLPLTVYFDILWEESYPLEASLARKYEKRILQRADRRFAITEFAVGYLEKKHGLKVDLLPHVIDVAEMPCEFQPLSNGSAAAIHFCGGIYPKMNQDSVVRLAAAAKRAKVRPALDLCTAGIPAELRDQGLTCRYLRRDELRAAQRRSTILYLPQAFQSDRPVMIRHNFPTKTMEYLCSGRPILVHSPPDSYLTWLAKREGFALVVDQPDVGELAAAIDRLVEDRSLQEELVAKALAFVRTRDSKPWALKFWESLHG